MLGISLTDLIRSRTSREDVWSFYLNRARQNNEILNAFTSLCEDPDTAKLPIAVKDNIATPELPTTASSQVLEKYMSPYTATVYTRACEGGLGAMGKTNLDAWAHGSSTETSDYGPTRNPYNHDYVPGGSSGGSAAAVAAGLAPAALGTETAGSIRLPAAWSGVVGLKPSYGRVSRYGIVAMGSSFDCPGPITQTVEDAAYILECIAGHDSHDATTSSEAVGSYADNLHTDKKLRIGVAEAYFDNVDPEIAQSVRQCIEMLRDAGHTIVPTELIHPKYAISVYMLLQRSEVSSNLARYDGIRYGQNRSHFGQEAERRIMLGTYALSAGYYDAYYKRAQKVRYVIREDFARVFKTVDALIAPTAPITATKRGASDDYAFYGEMMDILSEPAAVAGIPAISIPCGLHSNGLPMGVQIMGNYMDEQTILNVAHQLEGQIGFDRLSVMHTYE